MISRHRAAPFAQASWLEHATHFCEHLGLGTVIVQRDQLPRRAPGAGGPGVEALPAGGRGPAARTGSGVGRFLSRDPAHFGTNLLRSGGGIVTVAKLMGDRRLDTTRQSCPPSGTSRTPPPSSA
ncbi:MAG: hypothetical protein M3Z75_07760 [Actinomycetota bacterium]|nr:hypothetical protein [Actinomycetota bacterium]